RLITAAIWTVHFDLDNDMWLAENRIIDAVRDLQPDVMGFLESDTERIIMGQRDWTQRVSEELGYYVDYGPSPRKHTWGCAMISKFPIVNSTHHLLPSPVGELACAIHATLDVHGRPVDVIISHNGQEENPLDRRLQTTELARIMRESQNPFIFTGYVVTKPHAENYRILYDQGRIHDIDPTDSDRWCQYIGYRGLKRVGYARVSRGTITDTEIQVGKFAVPLPGEDISAWKPSYKRVDEAHYAPEYHFPKVFRGKGVRGHFYHKGSSRGVPNGLASWSDAGAMLLRRFDMDPGMAMALGRCGGMSSDGRAVESSNERLLALRHSRTSSAELRSDDDEPSPTSVDDEATDDIDRFLASATASGGGASGGVRA
ncbi:Protein cwh43, partial [Coemansia sp. S85]